MKKILLGLLLSTMVFQTAGVASASASQATTSITTNSGTQAGTEKTAAGARLATTKVSLNLRVGPSKSTNVIRNLPKGEQLVIFGQADAHWYHAQDSKGNIGYVSADSQYTNITGTPQSGHIVSGVNLRTEPSTSSSVIKLLNPGHEVAILKTVNPSWLQVWDGQGKVGYISSSSKYIKKDGSGSTVSSSPSTHAQIEKVISAGLKYLGTPYEFGSNRSTTTTFDCSDFVRQAYKEATGIDVGTDSRQQGAWVKSHSTVKKNISSLQRGDLMFFMSYNGADASGYSDIDKDKERITHVGIYLGDGKILHTYSKASGGVRIDTVVGKTWESRFLFGGSVLKSS